MEVDGSKIIFLSIHGWFVGEPAVNLPGCISEEGGMLGWPVIITLGGFLETCLFRILAAFRVWDFQLFFTPCPFCRGTPKNNHFLVDGNGDFQPFPKSKGLESFNWKKQFEKVDVSGYEAGTPVHEWKLQNWLSQWPTFKLLGMTYLIAKIKFKLFFHGPLAE